MSTPGHEAGPYAVITLVSLENALGKRLSYTHLHWGFGHGLIRNEHGSCVDVATLWSANAYKRLKACNLYDPKILDDAHLRIESWADHTLMAFALHALATQREGELHRVDRLRQLVDNLLLEPIVDTTLPLDPTEWRAHPEIASGVVRCT